MEKQDLKKLKKVIQKCNSREDVVKAMDELYYSRENVRKQFENKYKITPLKYWHATRFKKTLKNIYKTKNVKISAIENGYKSEKHFYRDYKKFKNKNFSVKQMIFKRTILKIVVFILLILLAHNLIYKTSFCNMDSTRIRWDILGQGTTTIIIERDCD